MNMTVPSKAFVGVRLWEARYARSLQIIHWSIALLVLVQFALIVITHQLKSMEFGQVVLSAHRQCGLALLGLILSRWLIGIWVRVPKLDVPSWQSTAARVIHGSMYFILALQPILGVLVSWSRGDEIMLLGTIRIPTLIAVSPEQGLALQPWHSWLGYGLLALLAIHLAAVIFNRVVRKTSVLDRMLPARSRQPRRPVRDLTRLCMCLGVMVSVVLFAGGFAMRQYNTFVAIGERIDSNESALLDEMRVAQLDLVTSQSVSNDQRSVAETTELSNSAITEIRSFPPRLTDADAKAAAAAAAKATTNAVASENLQAAIDAQSMVLFQGRMEMAASAAAGHDMILVAIAPTIFLSLILALLMAASVMRQGERRGFRQPQPTTRRR